MPRVKVLVSACRRIVRVRWVGGHTGVDQVMKCLSTYTMPQVFKPSYTKNHCLITGKTDVYGTGQTPFDDDRT